MDTNDLGRWGEDRAAAYLRLHGYSIVERNFSGRFGEIDIIAKKAGFIVFAEVKLRKSDEYGTAAEFVTASKQRRIISTAQLWLMKNDCELQPRFDVIEIYAPNGRKGSVTVHHIEDAFM